MTSIQKHPLKTQAMPSDVSSTFICHHNFDRISLVEKKKRLKTSCKILEKKIAVIDKRLEDIDHFFESFGSLNKTNVATNIMDKYSERKLERHEQLMDKLLVLENQLNECQRSLDYIDESAMLEACGCMG